MLNQNNNLLTSICKILGVILILSISLLTINTFYSSDDYGFMYNVDKYGVLKYCIDGYFNWDGRFLSLGAFVQCNLIKYLPVEFITFIWSTCFLVSGYIMFKIVCFERKIIFQNKKHLSIFALLLISTLWVLSIKHISETIYWATGGVYSLQLFLGAIWTYLYVYFEKKQINFVTKVLFLTFSIIQGASTQNLAFPLMTLVFIGILANLEEKTNLSFKILIFIALFFGLAFISFAPGNSLRMLATGLKPINKIGILELFENLFKVIKTFGIRSVIVIILLIFIALYLKKVNIKSFKFYSNKISFIENLVKFKWLLVAISSFFPFVFAPAYLGHRTTIYFIFFLQLFLVDFIVSKNNNQFKVLSKNYLKSIALFFILVLLFVGYNFYKGFQLKSQITERTEILKRSNGKVISIKIIDPKYFSPCYRFSDYPLDDLKNESFIINTQQEYFGIKKIIPFK